MQSREMLIEVPFLAHVTESLCFEIVRTNEDDLEKISELFEWLGVNGLTYFSSEEGIVDILAAMSNHAMFRKFVLSASERFMGMVLLSAKEIGGSIGETRALLEAYAEKVIHIHVKYGDVAGVLKSVPEGVFTELGATEETLSSWCFQEWVIFLHMCVSFDAFKSALVEIGQQTKA